MKFTYLRNIYYYVYIIISVIVISLLNLFLINIFTSNVSLYKYYSNVNYDYTVNMDNYKEDSYYIIDESFSLKLNDDLSLSGYINALSLMETNNEYKGLGYYKESNVISGEYKTLNYNECAITYNISTKYNINIGATLYNLNNGSILEYKVKCILKDTYDFSSPKSGECASYIFSGYNKKKINNTRYLGFCKIDDEPELNASNYLIVSNLKKSIKRELVIYSFVVICIYFILIGLYYILNRKDVISMIRLYNLTYSKTKLIKYLFIEMIFTMFFILLLSFIPSLIKENILYLLLESFIIVISIFLINLFKLFRRIK